MSNSTVVTLRPLYNEFSFLQSVGCVGPADRDRFQVFVGSLLEEHMQFELPDERRISLLRTKTYLRDFMHRVARHIPEMTGNEFLPLPIACALATIGLGLVAKDVSFTKNDLSFETYYTLLTPVLLNLKLHDADDEDLPLDLTKEGLDPDNIFLCMMDANFLLRQTIAMVRSEPSAYLKGRGKEERLESLNHVRKLAADCIWPVNSLSRENDELANTLEKIVTRLGIDKRAGSNHGRAGLTAVHS